MQSLNIQPPSIDFSSLKHIELTKPEFATPVLSRAQTAATSLNVTPNIGDYKNDRSQCSLQSEIQETTNQLTIDKIDQSPLSAGNERFSPTHINKIENPEMLKVNQKYNDNENTLNLSHPSYPSSFSQTPNNWEIAHNAFDDFDRLLDKTEQKTKLEKQKFDQILAAR